MIYAVSPDMQKKEVNEFCFGLCGKIVCAGIDIGEYGSFFPCRQDTCPHEEAITPVIGQVLEEDVCIRKLKRFSEN